MGYAQANRHVVVKAALLLAAMPASADLSVSEAVRAALAHSPELAAAGLEAQVLDSFALEEQAPFDPLLSIVVGREQVVGRDLSSSGILFDYRTDDLVGEARLTQLLPIGTVLEAGATTEVVDESRDGQQLVEASLGVTIRQPVVGGVLPKANQGRIRAARHQAEAARWEARAFAETLATLVEQTCWDAALAEAQILLLEASVGDARALLAEIDERVASGALARTDRVAAESEVALRGQQLVEVRMELDLAQALLSGYLGPGAAERTAITDSLVSAERVADSVDAHIATARTHRPDRVVLRELGLRAEDEVVRAKHGLLPRIDLWAEAAVLGYADGYSRAWDDLDGDHWRFSAGVALAQSLARSDDRADYDRELARRRQVQETARAVEERIATEVRTAHALVRRWLEASEAIAATRALDEEKLRIEAERFALGRASSFQVARAQRDLIERRLEEVEALAEHRKAWAELHRAEGRQLAAHGMILESVAGSAVGEP